MREPWGLTVEDVMRMPFCRFMALQKLQVKQQIEARNAEKKAQWRAENERDK